MPGGHETFGGSTFVQESPAVPFLPEVLTDEKGQKILKTVFHSLKLIRESEIFIRLFQNLKEKTLTTGSLVQSLEILLNEESEISQEYKTCPEKIILENIFLLLEHLEEPIKSSEEWGQVLETILEFFSKIKFNAAYERMRGKPVIITVNGVANPLADSDRHEIIHIESPDEALAKAQENKPDLIICDSATIHEADFCKRMRSTPLLGSIPIVVVDDNENEVRLLKAGATDVIQVGSASAIIRIQNHLQTARTIKDQDLEINLLKEDAEQRIKDLVEASKRSVGYSLDMLHGFIRLGETRDNETGEHIKRVGLFARAIAKEMGETDHFCDHIEAAAPVHDIGKIGIPDNILHKEGKLDDDEWAIMKTHTTQGEEAIFGTDMAFVMARNITGQHHEKCNGSGYPRGLSIDEIALESSITAVADIFDALTSKRSYKDAFPYEKALEIIKEETAKGNLDPEVVEAFIRIFDKIIAIKEKYADKLTEAAA